MALLVAVIAISKLTGQETKGEPEKPFALYNSVGAGYGENRMIITDNIHLEYQRFVIGIAGRVSTRKFWRMVHSSPSSSYDEFRFVNEIAPVVGYRVFDDEISRKLIITAGPMWRFENARAWPIKGSGYVPPVGFLLEHWKQDDIERFGFMVAAEFYYVNIASTMGGGLRVFASFVPGYSCAGITLNFVFGRL